MKVSASVAYNLLICSIQKRSPRPDCLITGASVEGKQCFELEKLINRNTNSYIKNNYNCLISVALDKIRYNQINE